MELKRILPLLALVMCIVVMLVSCDSLVVDKDAVSKSTEKDTLGVREMEKMEGYTVLPLAGLSSSDIVSNDGIVLLYKVDNDITSYLVYNMNTASEVGTFSYAATDLSMLASEGVTTPVSVVNGITEVATLTNDSHAFTYITPAKRVIKEKSAYKAVYINDCMQVGTTVYRLDPETHEVTASYERADILGAIPTCDDWTDEYYYDYSGTTVTVYDAEYQCIFKYTAPSYATNCDTFLFEDGYLVMQYWYAVDFMEDHYDILDGTAGKYNLVTLRINPKNGDVKELNTKYILESVVPFTEDLQTNSVYGDKVKNLVTAYEIKDRRISKTEQEQLVLNLNSRLSGDRINELDGQNVSPAYIANGYVVYVNADQTRAWVVSAKGKVIGEIGYTDIAFTEKYIITKKAIYNYELEKVSNLTVSGDPDDLIYVGLVGSKPLFKSTHSVATHYIYEGVADENGDVFRMLGDKASLMTACLKYGFYGKRSGEGANMDTTYYDAAGNVLFTVKYADEVSFMQVGSEKCILVRIASTENGIKYYRVEQ